MWLPLKISTTLGEYCRIMITCEANDIRIINIRDLDQLTTFFVFQSDIF